MNEDRQSQLRTLPTYRNQDGEAMALALFHEMAERVPAYKDFLAKHELDHKTITTYEDFQARVPIIDKPNYLSQYPLAMLCMDGDVYKHNIISVSSGSTGVPFFWPRGLEQDEIDTEMIARAFDGLGMSERSTLLVSCFSLGTWIAGTLMLVSSMHYADKGNRVSVMSPGIEKASAIDVVKRLGDQYEQVILCGYPPFLKDLIEDGTKAGIDWSKHNVGLFTGGEAYSEEWRDYVLELVGSQDDPYEKTCNMFGAADVGVVAYETPSTIAMRREFNAQKDTARQVFGREVLPAMYEYNPLLRHFELVNDELCVSSNSGIPLVRYNLKDTGGIVAPEEVSQLLGDKLTQRANEHNVDMSRGSMPIVYLHGRKDFVITVYSVNVYPENVKTALLNRDIRQLCSGKFTMATMTDENMDQSFEVNVELVQDVVATTADQETIEDAIVATLCERNSEYRKLYETMSVKARPQVRLISFGDQNYFARGIKHRWTAKKETK